MKKKFMLFTLASGIILSAFSLKSFSANAAETTPATESADVAIDAENFPDEYLRKDIQSFDLNRDGVLDEAEIAKATMISIPNETSTVKGLEYFTALEDLSVCLNDNLSALDLSDFVSLQKLYLSKVPNLVSINLNGCSSLQRLELYHMDGLSSVE